MMALSKELTVRGHRVTFFQKPELEDRVRQHGLGFHPIGSSNHSSVEKERNQVDNGLPTSITALRSSIDRIVDEVRLSLGEMPAVLIQCGIDTLIVDEIVLAGPTVAQILGIPYFVLSTSVPLNFGWPVSYGSPLHWFAGSFWLWLRKALLEVSIVHLRGPVRWRLDGCRRRLGLGPTRTMEREFQALAHIAQLPECLDFPRSRLHDRFYYTGPLADRTLRPSVEFPWHRLDGRPLVYMSLGTTRSVLTRIFRFVAEACNILGLQLAITLGGRRIPDDLANLPGGPIVVEDAPQLELLKRAEIVVTHGGLNTVLEALMEGKPMLVLPIAYDQPAVAARLAWRGVAEVIPAGRITIHRLVSSLQRIVTTQAYRTAALGLQGQIRKVDGLKRAADLIESALEYRSGSRERACDPPGETAMTMH